GQTPFAGQTLVQALAVHVLHDQIGPRPVHARIQHADDVRMLQSASDLAFAGEAHAEPHFAEDALSHDLDGDDPAAALVLTLVDGAHAALADLVQDQVVADFCAGDLQAHWIHGSALGFCYGSVAYKRAGAVPPAGFEPA